MLPKHTSQTIIMCIVCLHINFMLFYLLTRNSFIFSFLPTKKNYIWKIIVDMCEMKIKTMVKATVSYATKWFPICTYILINRSLQSSSWLFTFHNCPQCHIIIIIILIRIHKNSTEYLCYGAIIKCTQLYTYCQAKPF